MQISESRSKCVVFIRCGLALVVLVALALGVAGAEEAAQPCSDRVAPQDLETISSPAQVPGVYVARVNAGDAEHVTDLFATDAVHRGPDGQIRRGRAAILEFYEGILANGPQVAVGKSVADRDRAAFELILLQGCNEEDTATAMEIVDINEDGRIQEFTVFVRPDGP